MCKQKIQVNCLTGVEIRANLLQCSLMAEGGGEEEEEKGENISFVDRCCWCL